MQTENNQAKESLQNSPLITQNVNSTDTVYQSLKTEIQNENISDLTSILKDIPLNNLNDYYSIETSIFKKRIEKLNLQFFWIYESILQGQNINMNNSKDNTNNINSNTKLIFPYNKLFLILFKEISLYIEEITRLNKQLSAKNKNEKFYLKKINDYKNKEKEYFINKQMIKTLQRNIRNLEKNIEKIKKENEKLNKKLFSQKYSHFKNTEENRHSNNNRNYLGISINNNINNYRYQNFQKANTIYNEYYGFNNINDQGSITNSNNDLFSIKTFINKIKNKNQNNNHSKNDLYLINKEIINSCDRLYEKNENIFENNETENDNKNIIYLSINQCQDEINNLNKIENLLRNNIQNENRIINRDKNKSLKNLMNTPINNIKYKINTKQNTSSSNKKILFTDKKFKKIKKNFYYKANIITSRKKSD